MVTDGKGIVRDSNGRYGMVGMVRGRDGDGIETGWGRNGDEMGTEWGRDGDGMGTGERSKSLPAL